MKKKWKFRSNVSTTIFTFMLIKYRIITCTDYSCVTLNTHNILCLGKTKVRTWICLIPALQIYNENESKGHIGSIVVYWSSPSGSGHT